MALAEVLEMPSFFVVDAVRSPGTHHNNNNGPSICSYPSKGVVKFFLLVATPNAHGTGATNRVFEHTATNQNIVPHLLFQNNVSSYYSRALELYDIMVVSSHVTELYTLYWYGCLC